MLSGGGGQDDLEGVSFLSPSSSSSRNDGGGQGLGPGSLNGGGLGFVGASSSSASSSGGGGGGGGGGSGLHTKDPFDSPTPIADGIGGGKSRRAGDFAKNLSLPRGVWRPFAGASLPWLCRPASRRGVYCCEVLAQAALSLAISAAMEWAVAPFVLLAAAITDRFTRHVFWILGGLAGACAGASIVWCLHRICYRRRRNPHAAAMYYEDDPFRGDAPPLQDRKRQGAGYYSSSGSSSGSGGGGGSRGRGRGTGFGGGGGNGGGAGLPNITCCTPGAMRASPDDDRLSALAAANFVFSSMLGWGWGFFGWSFLAPVTLVEFDEAPSSSVPGMIGMGAYPPGIRPTSLIHWGLLFLMGGPLVTMGFVCLCGLYAGLACPARPPQSRYYPPGRKDEGGRSNFSKGSGGGGSSGGGRGGANGGRDGDPGGEGDGDGETKRPGLGGSASDLPSTLAGSAGGTPSSQYEPDGEGGGGVGGSGDVAGLASDTGGYAGGGNSSDGSSSSSSSSSKSAAGQKVLRSASAPVAAPSAVPGAGPGMPPRPPPAGTYRRREMAMMQAMGGLHWNGGPRGPRGPRGALSGGGGGDGSSGGDGGSSALGGGGDASPPPPSSPPQAQRHASASAYY